MDALSTELEELVAIARSMFARGYSFGTAGNISIRHGDTIYATPTGSSFGTLTVPALAPCDGSDVVGNCAFGRRPYDIAQREQRRRRGEMEPAGYVAQLRQPGTLGLCGRR